MKATNAPAKRITFVGLTKGFSFSDLSWQPEACGAALFGCVCSDIEILLFGAAVDEKAPVRRFSYQM
ncbi:MAG: hypothetical protein RR655_02970, partial [Raoultibacter sp.]